MQPEFTKKICLITGANSGIGKATAIGLAKLGMRIVMVCRNKDKGTSAQQEIMKISKNSSIDLLIADLANLNDIRNVVRVYKEKYARLDILINNAGIYQPKPILTVDGIEQTFAVNHFSHFLLTNLLLDLMKKNTPARIINVSSAGHFRATINFDKITDVAILYKGFEAYTASKLANILFTYELADRLNNTNITVNALHPGIVRTNIAHSRFFSRFIWQYMPFFVSAHKGAETSIFLSSSPELSSVTGKYFVKKRPVPSSSLSYNKDLQQKLWNLSVQLTGLYK